MLQFPTQQLKTKQRTIKSILEHFYTDDFLDSFSSQTEATNICKKILHDREILKSLPQDDLSANCQSVNPELDKISLERALDILWNPDNDTIKVKAVIKSFSLSKRGVLSFISSAFDPF